MTQVYREVCTRFGKVPNFLPPSAQQIAQHQGMWSRVLREFHQTKCRMPSASVSPAIRTRDAGSFSSDSRCYVAAIQLGSYASKTTAPLTSSSTLSSDYLSTRIWAPLAMERDGYWLLDASDGLETGGDEISGTLRDYARFGQFFLCAGVIRGKAVLPPGWRDLAARPHTPIAAYGQVDDDPLGFGYQWWAFPTGQSALPSPTGPSPRRASSASFFMSTPRKTSWRSSGVRGDRHGTTGPRSRHTQ